MKNLFNPNKGMLLVKPEILDEEKVGKIIVSGKTLKNYGKVIAVGPSHEDVLEPQQVGNIVYYGPNTGTPLNLENEDYLVMKATAVYGHSVES